MPGHRRSPGAPRTSTPPLPWSAPGAGPRRPPADAAPAGRAGCARHGGRPARSGRAADRRSPSPAGETPGRRMRTVLTLAACTALAHAGPAAAFLPGPRRAFLPRLAGIAADGEVALTFDDGPAAESTPH